MPGLCRFVSAAAVNGSASLGGHFLLPEAWDYHSHRTHSQDSAGNAAAMTEFMIAVNLENEHLTLLTTTPFSHLTLTATGKSPAMNSAPGMRVQGMVIGLASLGSAFSI